MTTITARLRNNRGLLLFILCFGFFRTAVADWNPIPTGSMRPTLLEGDVVLVNRLAYDFKLPLSDVIVTRLGEPARGDIVTFSSPKDGMRLIKRVAAVPGDVVAMQGGMLWINGQAARYDGLTQVAEPVAPGVLWPATRATERLAGKAHAVQYLDGRLDGRTQARTFGPLTVPAGHYFMLGDNRDNSEDSRAIGLVPRHKLIGRAERTLVSADILGQWRPRLERTWAALN